MRGKENASNFFQKYWVYVVSLVIFIIIRILPITVLERVDKIVNEIAVGAFASVLVALIIAVHDDNVREQDNRIILSRLVLPFYSALAEYLQSFSLICGLENSKLKSNLGTFKDWYLLYDKLNKDGLMENTYFEVIKSDLDNISELAGRIKESEVILLKLGIINRETIDEITEIARITYLLDMMYGNNVFVNNIRTVNEELNDYLSQSKIFRRLTSEKYGWDRRTLTDIAKAIEQYSKK